MGRPRAPSVQVPASKRKLAIAKVLEKEGYLGSVKAENVDGKDMLTLELKYYRTSRSSSASSV
jgi:small subunit ribosomal protein S8